MKRFLAFCLLAFAAMHILGSVLLLIRFQTAKPLSLILGPTFLVLGIWLYKSSKKK